MGLKLQRSWWGLHRRTSSWSGPPIHFLGCSCLLSGCWYSWSLLSRTESFNISLRKGVRFFMFSWLSGGSTSRGELRCWLGIGWDWQLVISYWVYLGFSFLFVLGERSMIRVGLLSLIFISRGFFPFSPLVYILSVIFLSWNIYTVTPYLKGTGFWLLHCKFFFIIRMKHLIF